MNTPSYIDRREQRLLVTLSDNQRADVRQMQAIIKDRLGLDISQASVIRGAVDAYKRYLMDQSEAVFDSYERRRLIAINGLSEKRFKQQKPVAEPSKKGGLGHGSRENMT